MITIGLVTFSDHPSLINGEDRQVKLAEYTGHFPIVELDTPFYGIPRESTILNWQQSVPDNFQFILKANKLMTLHDLSSKDHVDEDTRISAFKHYRKVVEPLVDSHQLASVLFQFSPSFKRSVESFDYLRKVRQLMGKLPITIEFRNASWYGPEISQSVVDYLKELKMSLVIVDEPHANNQGVPFEMSVSNPDFVMLRLHGRNQAGWNDHVDWRKKRTLYRYSTEELTEIAQMVLALNQQAKKVAVIFNNNAGKDAADNAIELKKILGIEFDDLSPMQLDLF